MDDILAIVGIIVGSIGAVAGAAAAVYTVRSARRLSAASALKTEREADHEADITSAELRRQLTDEFNRRMGLELQVSRLTRRVERLEEQVRQLGYTPVNGD
jgi:predicted ATP-grasp superfamily ATP-dependent carboligase